MTFIQNFLHSRPVDAFNFFESFTGGSFTTMSLFALNITPYITSSIIMQLLTIAIPTLEEMQKEGEEGRKKIANITRYVTVGLALLSLLQWQLDLDDRDFLSEYNFVNVQLSLYTYSRISALLCGLENALQKKVLETVFLSYLLI